MKTGVSIILYRSNFDLLLGKRKGSHGAGSLANPGGHVELSESPLEAGYREVEEETGIDLTRSAENTYLLPRTEDRFEEGKTYQTHHYAIQVDDSIEAELTEPDKFEFWKWYSIHEVIELYEENRLFLPLRNLFASFESEMTFPWLENTATFSLAYLFSGPAGSGKGTQGKIIQNRIGMPHISTGEMFRRIAQEGSERGDSIKEYMDRGDIIPPDLAFQAVRSELSKLRYRFGFILDGYPKDLESMEFLLGVFQDLNIRIMKVFYFDMAYELNKTIRNSTCLPSGDRISSKVSLNVLADRLCNRLLCKVCELNYHPVYSPPNTEGVCDSCERELTFRSDDQDIETVERRIEVFRSSTLPVIDELEKRGIEIVRIDACLRIPDVTADILRHTVGEEDDIDLVHNLKPVFQTHHHSHLDGKNLAVLEEVIHLFHSRESGRKAALFDRSVKPGLRQKIYPVQYLLMGKQARETMKDLYRSLDNFHIIGPLKFHNEKGEIEKEEEIHSLLDGPKGMSITSSVESPEAFATMMYGKTANYAYMREMLKFLAENVKAINANHDTDTAIQFEYEEEVYSDCIDDVTDEFSEMRVELDLIKNSVMINNIAPDREMSRRLRIFDRAMERYDLNRFEKQSIPNLPLFEIHHGFDILKAEGETEPPISLQDLEFMIDEFSSDLIDFDIGGIFVFEKEDRWAYRTNEFHNGPYAITYEKTQEQQAILLNMLNIVFNQVKSIRKIEGPVPLKASIEIVHRIWRFD
jgi:adenylate kinase